MILFATAISNAEISRWFAKSWQTDDGLPNNTVLDLAQTPDGFIWLGTPTGLARFDGVKFQRIPSNNLVLAPNRGILSMVSLSDGGLALAMDRGALVLLRSNVVRSFFPGRELPDGFPFSMAEDNQGAIWVSYREGSICRILSNQVTRVAEPVGVATPSTICALTVDQEGHIWFAVGGQLGRIRNERMEVLHAIPTAVTRLACARDGGIWICSGGRIFKFRMQTGLKELGKFGNGMVTPPTALLEDRDGGLWIGTAYQGVYHFDGTSFESVATSHKEIMSLMEDREGSIWAGTAGGGLNQIRARVVELEGTEEGLPFEAVQSLCEGADGVYWAATQNGALARCVAGKWKSFLPETNWPAQATCVAADPSGAIWIGTRMNGLFCWKGNRLQAWGNTNDLKGKTIHALQVTGSGDLWIGEASPNALQRLRGGVLTTMDIPTEDIRVIRATTLGADGSVWVGASRGTLLRVTRDRIVDETDRTLGQDASIRCLYTSDDGTIWIGYAGGGLGFIRDGQFTNLRSEQGLYDDNISHIVADGQGWLWFGGDRGVFKVRLQELYDFSKNRIPEVRSIHYGRGEGLPSLQANFGGAPGAFRSRDGRIWIPMRTALAVISPDRLRENSEPPTVLLDRVVVDDVSVAMNRGMMLGRISGGGKVPDLRNSRTPLRLSPGHHRVQFEFTAPSFIAPENVRFRYRLEGFDNDWIDIENERFAAYSRLPAGNYKFHVVAASDNDLWTETGASLELSVAPFFWQTWYFRALMLMLFTGFIIAIVRYVSFRRLRLQVKRLEQQEALYKERARIAKDIHDDVGANLTQIALLGDLVQQDGGVQQSFGSRLETISRTARQAVKSLDEIVWAVNPRNDTLAHLIDYTGQFSLDYLRVAGIRCRLDLPEQPPELAVSTDVRHNLFLVVKEALNNIVKHARATEVWLRVGITESHLEIAVEDNGVGFDRTPANSDADGLRNMQQRMADIGGTCCIESHIGAGTKVRASLLLPSSRRFKSARPNGI